MRTSDKVGILTITGGTAESNALPLSPTLSRVLGSAVDFTIYSPSTLSGTITVQASPKDAPTASDWYNVSIGGSDVTIAATKATVVPIGGIRSIRLISSTNELSTRTFTIMAQFDIGS